MDLKKKTIIVCSIVRDAELGLRRNIPVISEVCRWFGDYKVVVFENDSKDKTKQLLKDWMVKDPNHVFAFMKDTDGKATIPTFKESKGNPFFGHKRIDRMAVLRNQYMDLLWEKGWEADYLMVVDLDVARIYLKGVITSFDEVIAWDAVTAFGYSLSPTLKPRYHDTYALTMYGDDEPQTEQKIAEMRFQLASLGDGSQWIRVASAFGGIAIYKMEAVKGVRYEVYDNKDNRVEVMCEHYSIYKQMRERGYDKVYINPLMQVKYQEVNINNIKKYLRNKLDRYRKRKVSNLQ